MNNHPIPTVDRDEAKAICAHSKDEFFDVGGMIVNPANVFVGRLKPASSKKPPERFGILERLKDINEVFVHYNRKMIRATEIIEDVEYTWINTPKGGNYIPTAMYAYVRKHWPNAVWFMGIYGSTFTAIDGAAPVALTCGCPNPAPPAGKRRIESFFTPQTMSMHYRLLTVACSKEFSDIFGASLTPFMDPITLFDLIKFEERFFGKDRDESIHDMVLEKYGQPGVDMIKALIGSGPLSASQCKNAVDALGVSSFVECVTAWYAQNSDVKPEHDLEIIKQ